MLPALNDVLFAAILICSLSYTFYYIVTQICRYLVPNVCLGLTHKAISFHASGIVAPAFPDKNPCFGLGLSLLRSTLCPYQTGFFSPWRLMCIPFSPFPVFRLAFFVPIVTRNPATFLNTIALIPFPNLGYCVMSCANC